jgi:hypothetical protein
MAAALTKFWPVASPLGAAEQLDELASFSRSNLQLDRRAGVGLNEMRRECLRGSCFIFSAYDARIR